MHSPTSHLRKVHSLLPSSLLLHPTHTHDFLRFRQALFGVDWFFCCVQARLSALFQHPVKHMNSGFRSQLPHEISTTCVHCASSYKACCVRMQDRNKCDIFTYTLVSMCYCGHLCTCVHVRSALECQAKTVFFTLVITSGYTDRHNCVTQPTMVAKQVTGHFVDPQVAACTRCTAEKRACLFQAVTGGEEINLRPSDPSLFNFIVAPWLPQLFLRCYICVTLLEVMLRRVQARIFTMLTQQVSMDGNFVLDYALPVNLVINTPKRCLKSVTDCVVTHSSRHKMLASIFCANLLTEDHAGIDMRRMVLTAHESKELFRQYLS